MNIYLVSRTDDWGYDDWDSFVVAASDEETARNTRPDGVWKDGRAYGWVPLSKVDTLKVELIGTTETHDGVILASYNAG